MSSRFYVLTISSLLLALSVNAEEVQNPKEAKEITEMKENANKKMKREMMKEKHDGKQIEGYKKDAQTVIDLIDKIGEIIDENEEENINNAKAAYDALSKPARQYVTNYDKLTDSMKKLESYLLNQN